MSSVHQILVISIVTFTLSDCQNRLEYVQKNGKDFVPFSSIDASADGKLSKKEVSWMISRFMQKHLSEAIRTNMRSFMLLDKMHPNGLVEWDEWYEQFMQNHKNEDKSDRGFKEKVSAAKAAWTEAARANPDRLNIDEYLAFTHSEFSQPLIMQEAEELLAILDTDTDGVLSLEEYLGRVEGEEKLVRQITFPLIDRDSDNRLSRNELLPSMDAKSEIWARREAERLFLRFDADRDGAIDRKEFSDELVQSLLPDTLFHSIF